MNRRCCLHWLWDRSPPHCLSSEHPRPCQSLNSSWGYWLLVLEVQLQPCFSWVCPCAFGGQSQYSGRFESSLLDWLLPLIATTFWSGLIDAVMLRVLSSLSLDSEGEDDFFSLITVASFSFVADGFSPYHLMNCYYYYYRSCCCYRYCCCFLHSWQ